VFRRGFSLDTGLAFVDSLSFEFLRFDFLQDLSRPNLAASFLSTIKARDQWFSPRGKVRQSRTGLFFDSRSRREFRLEPEQILVVFLPSATCVLGDEEPNGIFVDAGQAKPFEQSFAIVDGLLRGALVAMRNWQ